MNERIAINIIMSHNLTIIVTTRVPKFNLIFIVSRFPIIQYSQAKMKNKEMLHIKQI